jgi:hypothetical protein
MTPVAEVMGVSPGVNLFASLQEPLSNKRIGRPPPDNEPVAEIKAVIAGLLAYGYQRALPSSSDKAFDPSFPALFSPINEPRRHRLVSDAARTWRSRTCSIGRSLRSLACWP